MLVVSHGRQPVHSSTGGGGLRLWNRWYLLSQGVLVLKLRSPKPEHRSALYSGSYAEEGSGLSRFVSHVPFFRGYDKALRFVTWPVRQCN